MSLEENIDNVREWNNYFPRMKKNLEQKITEPVLFVDNKKSKDSRNFIKIYHIGLIKPGLEYEVDTSKIRIPLINHYFKQEDENTWKKSDSYYEFNVFTKKLNSSDLKPRPFFEENEGIVLLIGWEDVNNYLMNYERKVLKQEVINLLKNGVETEAINALV